MAFLEKIPGYTLYALHCSAESYDILGNISLAIFLQVLMDSGCSGINRERTKRLPRQVRKAHGKLGLIDTHIGVDDAVRDLYSADMVCLLEYGDCETAALQKLPRRDDPRWTSTDNGDRFHDVENF